MCKETNTSFQNFFVEETTLHLVDYVASCFLFFGLSGLHLHVYQVSLQFPCIFILGINRKEVDYVAISLLFFLVEMSFQLLVFRYFWLLSINPGCRKLAPVALWYCCFILFSAEMGSLPLRNRD